MLSFLPLLAALTALTALLATGCGAKSDSSTAPDSGNATNAGSSGGSSDGADSGEVGVGSDAGDAKNDDASTTDGTASRVACTSTFGSALTTAHGRLDGLLVSIVGEHERGCNGDSTHLHLQVLVKSAVYDVAVNIDGLEGEIDAPLPGAPWSEGWHESVPFDYVHDLGLHSDAIGLTSIPAVRQRVETLLAKANHVAIFATGYGPKGVHLVHRGAFDQDGAIAINPLDATSHFIAFRFAGDSF